MIAGLRVDVDTERGTRLGVPRLLETFARRGIHATFFFTVGPDNMGRHLWRLLKPAFLWKMLRSNAPSLYGWSILRCGVIGNGPDIGDNNAEIIRATQAAGHETGLHAWDHQRWQSMDLANHQAARQQLALGYERLTAILGNPPACSAAPAWRAPDNVLALKEELPFKYNSDSRGSICFIPKIGNSAGKPQVPVTLPTYDEMVGKEGVTDENYNQRMLELFKPDDLNVLCIHAEVEGIAKADLFDRFLDMAEERGIEFQPLGEVLASQRDLPVSEVAMRLIPGREGEVCCQG
jgi:Predicted xylanase/chitin deacetylase